MNQRSERRVPAQAVAARPPQPAVLRAALTALAALVLTVTTTCLATAHAALAHPLARERTRAGTELGIARRLRLTAWNFARRQRGKPYIWGGVGPRGYDCSGLVWAAYRRAGIVLPRTTYEMLDSHALIRITWRQARRGDLAFFGRDHVELFRYGYWTFGAEHTGTRVGFHQFNKYWHPTMYFRVR